MKIIFRFFFILSLFFVFPLSAVENAPQVDLKFNLLSFQQLCPQPLWKNVKVRWKGVKDLRPQPELASLDSDNSEKIYSSKPLNEVFDSSLKQLFQMCGMQWAIEGQEPVWELEGVIEKFESGQKKGVFTSKTMAQSQIKIIAKSFNRGIEARAGYEIEMKASRFKSFKKIESSLQELFEKTLQQILKSPDLRNIQSL